MAGRPTSSQAAAGITTRQVFEVARDYDDAEWTALVDGLVARGVLTAVGGLTSDGRELKNDIERRTDEIALSAYAVLDDEEVDRLASALTPIARAVVAAGDMPAVTPIGVRLDS